MRTRERLRAAILLLCFFLVGCNTAAPTIPESATPTVEPAATLTSAATSSPQPPSTPTRTPTLTPEPTPESAYPLRQPLEILSADFTRDTFQDLIVFTSLEIGVGPFASLKMDIRWAEPEPHLFAFSPDGRRAGALIPADYVSAIYLPSDPAAKPLLVEYGVEFDHPAVQGVQLPPECYQPLVTSERFLSCSGLQFSPDGRYLGFFYGPEGCWRDIIIQDTRTGIRAFQLSGSQPSGHYFVLLEGGEALVASGHCQGGSVALVELEYGGVKRLGEEGESHWNADRTALAVVIGSRASIQSSIWGYNFETDQYFLRVPEMPQIDDHPVWTPDKRYLLYQHRTFTRASDGITATGFDQPRQIILVDAQSGEQRTLLSHPGYDFHLGSCWYCEAWYGDWIQVRRVAFTPEPLTSGEDLPRTSQFTCRIYGENCSAPVELFALNWKTGELAPWDEMVRSGVAPDLNAIAQSGPDRTLSPIYENPDGRFVLYAGADENTVWLDRFEAGTILTAPDLTRKPVYQHPAGLYAYYVGIDGETLWMVPAEGEPELWVLRGRDYFYLPPKP